MNHLSKMGGAAAPSRAAAYVRDLGKKVITGRASYEPEELIPQGAYCGGKDKIGHK